MSQSTGILYGGFIKPTNYLKIFFLIFLCCNHSGIHLFFIKIIYTLRLWLQDDQRVSHYKNWSIKNPFTIFLLGSHVALGLPWTHYVTYVNKAGFEFLIQPHGLPKCVAGLYGAVPGNQDFVHPRHEFHKLSIFQHLFLLLFTEKYYDHKR